MWDFPLFPDRASTLAGRVDAVYLAVVGFAAFFAISICLVIVSFAIKYRRGSNADRSHAATENLKIELAWIIIPSVIALGLFFWAAGLFYRLFSPPSDASEIYVLGKQWMWEIQHPQGRRETNELHVPLGRPFRLIMTSKDVIHSFYVPAFRVKQDVLPGRYTSLWFQPSKVGRYHLFCAEYCGTKHSGMIGQVVIMEPAEFQQWLEAGTVTGSMAEAGSRLFRRYGCSGCHGAEASIRAPRLEGLFGKPVPLARGGFVTADERYVRDSILLPRSQVAAGFEPIMPSYRGLIGEDDLLQIIAYIRSLREKGRVE